MEMTMEVKQTTPENEKYVEKLELVRMQFSARRHPPAVGHEISRPIDEAGQPGGGVVQARRRQIHVREDKRGVKRRLCRIVGVERAGFAVETHRPTSRRLGARAEGKFRRVGEIGGLQGHVFVQMAPTV